MREAPRGRRTSGNTEFRTRTGSIRAALGECLLRLGRFAEAESLLVTGVRAMQTVHYSHTKAHYTHILIELYDSIGNVHAAQHWRACLRDTPLPSWELLEGAP